MNTSTQTTTIQYLIELEYLEANKLLKLQNKEVFSFRRQYKTDMKPTSTQPIKEFVAFSTYYQ
jgi:hypothetical protein